VPVPHRTFIFSHQLQRWYTNNWFIIKANVLPLYQTQLCQKNLLFSFEMFAWRGIALHWHRILSFMDHFFSVHLYFFIKLYEKKEWAVWYVGGKARNGGGGGLPIAVLRWIEMKTQAEKNDLTACIELTMQWKQVI
jgi:hypothetical protein